MSDTTQSSGIGFFGALCLLLIVLKVFGYITISWYWVLFPITVPITIMVVVFTGAGLILGGARIIEYISDKKNKKKRL